MCYLFQIQTQGNVGDVQLLAAVHPVLPAVQIPLWGSGVNAETTAPGTVAHTVLASAPVSVSATVQVETQAQAQMQAPGLVSAQGAAMPQTPASTLVTVPASAPVQAPVSASGSAFEPPKVSSTNSDASAVIGKPQLSVPGLVSAPISVMLPSQAQAAGPALASAPVAASVAAPILQPAGIQTAASMPECASLATTQQNLEMTSASSTLQQESYVEVGITKQSVNICHHVILNCIVYAHS